MFIPKDQIHSIENNSLNKICGKENKAPFISITFDQIVKVIPEFNSRLELIQARVFNPKCLILNQTISYPFSVGDFIEFHKEKLGKERSFCLRGSSALHVLLGGYYRDVDLCTIIKSYKDFKTSFSFLNDYLTEKILPKIFLNNPKLEEKDQKPILDFLTKGIFAGDCQTFEFDLVDYCISSDGYEKRYLTVHESVEIDFIHEEVRISSEAGKSLNEALETLKNLTIPFSEDIQERLNLKTPELYARLIWKQVGSHPLNEKLNHYLYQRVNQQLKDLKKEAAEWCKRTQKKQLNKYISLSDKTITNEVQLTYLFSNLVIWNDKDYTLSEEFKCVFDCVNQLIKERVDENQIQSFIFQQGHAFKNSSTPLDDLILNLSILEYFLPCNQPRKLPVCQFQEKTISLILPNTFSWDAFIRSKMDSIVLKPWSDEQLKSLAEIEKIEGKTKIEKVLQLILGKDSFPVFDLPTDEQLIIKWKDLLIKWGEKLVDNERTHFLTVSKKMILLIQAMKKNHDSLSQLSKLYTEILIKEYLHDQNSFERYFFPSLSKTILLNVSLDQLVQSKPSSSCLNTLLKPLLPFFPSALNDMTKLERNQINAILKDVLILLGEKADLSIIVYLLKLLNPSPDLSHKIKLSTQELQEQETHIQLQKIIKTHLDILISLVVNSNSNQKQVWDNLQILFSYISSTHLKLGLFLPIVKKGKHFPIITLKIVKHFFRCAKLQKADLSLRLQMLEAGIVLDKKDQQKILKELLYSYEDDVLPSKLWTYLSEEWVDSTPKILPMTLNWSKRDISKSLNFIINNHSFKWKADQWVEYFTLMTKEWPNLIKTFENDFDRIALCIMNMLGIHGKEIKYHQPIFKLLLKESNNRLSYENTQELVAQHIKAIGKVQDEITLRKDDIIEINKILNSRSLSYGVLHFQKLLDITPKTGWIHNELLTNLVNTHLSVIEKTVKIEAVPTLIKSCLLSIKLSLQYKPENVLKNDIRYIGTVKLHLVASRFNMLPLVREIFTLLLKNAKKPDLIEKNDEQDVSFEKHYFNVLLDTTGLLLGIAEKIGSNSDQLPKEIVKIIMEKHSSSVIYDFKSSEKTVKNGQKTLNKTKSATIQTVSLTELQELLRLIYAPTAVLNYYHLTNQFFLNDILSRLENQEVAEVLKDKGSYETFYKICDNMANQLRLATNETKKWIKEFSEKFKIFRKENPHSNLRLVIQPLGHPELIKLFSAFGKKLEGGQSTYDVKEITKELEVFLSYNEQLNQLFL